MARPEGGSPRSQAELIRAPFHFLCAQAWVSTPSNLRYISPNLGTSAWEMGAIRFSSSGTDY